MHYNNRGIVINDYFEVIGLGQNSPALESGLKKGDRLLLVNNVSIEKFYDYNFMIKNYMNAFTLELLRDGVRKKVIIPSSDYLMSDDEYNYLLLNDLKFKKEVYKSAFRKLKDVLFKNKACSIKKVGIVKVLKK